MPQEEEPRPLKKPRRKTGDIWCRKSTMGSDVLQRLLDDVEHMAFHDRKPPPQNGARYYRYKGCHFSLTAYHMALA